MSEGRKPASGNDIAQGPPRWRFYREQTFSAGTSFQRSMYKSACFDRQLLRGAAK
jgi:hypothetical protein